MELDVTSDDSVAAALDSVKDILYETSSELWCVVNNAAVLSFGEAEWQPTQMLEHQFAVNVIGKFASRYLISTSKLHL